jgi:hypothetical protein
MTTSGTFQDYAPFDNITVKLCKTLPAVMMPMRDQSPLYAASNNASSPTRIAPHKASYAAFGTVLHENTGGKIASEMVKSIKEL